LPARRARPKSSISGAQDDAARSFEPPSRADAAVTQTQIGPSVCTPHSLHGLPSHAQSSPPSQHHSVQDAKYASKVKFTEVTQLLCVHQTYSESSMGRAEELRFTEQRVRLRADKLRVSIRDQVLRVAPIQVRLRPSHAHTGR